MEHHKECVYSYHSVDKLYRGESVCPICDLLDFMELIDRKKTCVEIMKTMADSYCNNHRMLQIVKPQLDGSSAANMPGGKYMDADPIELEQAAMQSTIDMLGNKIRMMEYKIRIFEDRVSVILGEARSTRDAIQDYMKSNKISRNDQL